MPWPVVLGVEDDHAALLHVGVDLGERRLGQRPRVGQHRPVEHGKKAISSVRMLTANGSPGSTAVRAIRNLPSPIRPWRLASSVAASPDSDVAEGDLGGGLDGARVVARVGAAGARRALRVGAGPRAGSRCADGQHGDGGRAAPGARARGRRWRRRPCSSRTARMSANSRRQRDGQQLRLQRAGRRRPRRRADRRPTAAWAAASAGSWRVIRLSARGAPAGP